MSTESEALKYDVQKLFLEHSNFHIIAGSADLQQQILANWKEYAILHQGLTKAFYKSLEQLKTIKSLQSTEMSCSGETLTEKKELTVPATIVSGTPTPEPAKSPITPTPETKKKKQTNICVQESKKHAQAKKEAFQEKKKGWTVNCSTQEGKTTEEDILRLFKNKKIKDRTKIFYGTTEGELCDKFENVDLGNEKVPLKEFREKVQEGRENVGKPSKWYVSVFVIIKDKNLKNIDIMPLSKFASKFADKKEDKDANKKRKLEDSK